MACAERVQQACLTAPGGFNFTVTEGLRGHNLMFCVVYSSVAKPGTTEQDVDDIVEYAEAANSRNRITGALVFDGERFCQLLEGEKDKVMDTLERIYSDTRHSDIAVIGSTPVTDRRFPGWAMLRIEREEFETVVSGLRG